MVTLECCWRCSVSSNPAGVSFWIYYVAKKNKQLLRAPSVGKHSSTRVDEARKSWNLLAIKKCKARTVVGRGGEEPAMWPRIWVTTKRGGKQKDEDNKWDRKKIEKGFVWSHLSSGGRRAQNPFSSNYLKKYIYICSFSSFVLSLWTHLDC